MRKILLIYLRSQKLSQHYDLETIIQPYLDNPSKLKCIKMNIHSLSIHPSLHDVPGSWHVIRRSIVSVIEVVFSLRRGVRRVWDQQRHRLSYSTEQKQRI